ncbi:MAG: hypothetical protein IPK74_11335 [Deltaproteobacteria bacterium]|nr:hypothetical protein [Deltaproteobacteria bacterium]
MHELWARGHAQWPEFFVDPAVHAAFLAARVGADADPEQTLIEMSAEDLYLACGCVRGSEDAASAFRAYVAPAVHHAVTRIAPELVDDILSQTYDRLFLGSHAKIELYIGQGDLRRWVSVVASRIALDARRRDRSEDRCRTAAFHRVVEESPSFEFEYLKGACRGELKGAFAAAFESLDDQQRNLLRYQLDGVTADQVGRIYNVHRVTVARWLSRVRATLFDRTREILRVRLGLEARDADSILRLVDGDVSVSLQRLLESG